MEVINIHKVKPGEVDYIYVGRNPEHHQKKFKFTRYEIIVSEYKENTSEGARIIWEHNSKKDILDKNKEKKQTMEVLFTYNKEE